MKGKQSSVEVDRSQVVRRNNAKVMEEEEEEEEEEDGRCFKEDLGSNERNKSDDSNGKSGSYIDADQHTHTLSPATPTFGILQREGRSRIRTFCASTYRKEKPPQSLLGLPRVKWLPEKEIEKSLVAFFSPSFPFLAKCGKSGS